MSVNTASTATSTESREKSSLVERLRAYSASISGDNELKIGFATCRNAMLEAADEIERLQSGAA